MKEEKNDIKDTSNNKDIVEKTDEETTKDDNNNEKEENIEEDIKETEDVVEEQEFETVPDEPVFDEVEEKKKKKKKRTDSYFDGSLIELIGYHLLSGIITVFTLGIGRPWAECLVMGYKINHTVYNGKRLKFEGKGSSYFVQKFKWLIFTIITLGIYSFWIPINKVKWQVKNIHFEDEEFVTDSSYFDGKLIQLIGINLLSWLLITLSFGILYPFVHCMKIRWTTKHTIINRKKITFKGSALDLFAHYLLWVFLTIITFGIYGLWLGINYLKWQTKNTHIKLKDEVEEKDNNNELIISLIIVGIIFIIGSVIFYKILSNFKSTPNLEAEEKMKTTILTAKTEFANKQYTDEEIEDWSKPNFRTKLQPIKKLNLDALNEFDKNGGNGVFIYSLDYNNNKNINLILKYKNMVCVSEINSNPSLNTNNEIECHTLKEIISTTINFKSAGMGGRVETINDTNVERMYDY